MDYEYNILEQKMKSLPPDLQAAMVSVDIADSIQNIADKHSLHVDQAGGLSDVISLVILGLVPTKSFTLELSKRAEIKMSEAIAITQDVNTDIFNNIRVSLQKIQEQNELEMSENKPIVGPVPPPPPPTPPPTFQKPSNQPSVLPPQTPPYEAKAPITPPPKPPPPPPTPYVHPSEIKELEKHGNFTVEKSQPQSSSPQYKENNLNKEATLKHIEDLPAPTTDHLLADKYKEEI